MVFPPVDRLDRKSCVREVQPRHTGCKGDVKHIMKQILTLQDTPFVIRHSISPRLTSDASLHLPSLQERS